MDTQREATKYEKETIMSIPNQTIIGNIADDPQLNQTQSGKQRVTFTVIQQNRVKNQQTQQWEDGYKSVKRCTAYNQLALNIAHSLGKGMSVIAYGVEHDFQYTDKNGQTRYGSEFIVDDIGASLRWATVQVAKNQKQQSQSTYGSGAPQQEFTKPSATGFNQNVDPWAVPQGGEPEF